MNLSILNRLFTECWWWLLLWMFLAFILGWLLRKLFGSNNDCCKELEECKTNYLELEKKYEDVLNNRQTIADINTANQTNLTGVVANKFSPYSKLKEDNLQIIEGIGPKMEEVLKKNNILNWKVLSQKKPADLRTVLDNENPNRYKIIDPTTWPEQARLATDNKWEDLIELQKRLDTGKTTAIGMTDSKLEKIMIKLGLLKKWKKDDLKAIEGIGPKIEKLLNESGITTWKKLSESSVGTLKSILEKAGKRYKLADPGTWPKQALLADENKWDELTAYQDELNGGK